MVVRLIALAILLKIATHNIFAIFYCTRGLGQNRQTGPSNHTTRATHTQGSPSPFLRVRYHHFNSHLYGIGSGFFLMLKFL